jgi:hypothetical protein
MWDVIDALAEEVARVNKITEARHRLDDLKPRCGSCKKWMIKDYCKREESGHKVTCSERICNDYEEQGYVEKLRKELRDEIQALKCVQGK